MPKFQTVDQYIASVPEDRRGALEQLRRTARGAAPDATEVIAYDMPALRLDGRFLVSYASYKRHYSLFPWTDGMLAELGDELRRYATGKGTIQLPANEAVPTDLVRRVVEHRVAELRAGR